MPNVTLESSLSVQLASMGGGYQYLESGRKSIVH